jgi:hypothetical protein
MTIWGPSTTEIHLLIKPETAELLLEAAEFAIDEWDGIEPDERTEQWKAARQEVLDILNSPPPVLFKTRTE